MKENLVHHSRTLGKMGDQIGFIQHLTGNFRSYGIGHSHQLVDFVKNQLNIECILGFNEEKWFVHCGEDYVSHSNLYYLWEQIVRNP